MTFIWANVLKILRFAFWVVCVCLLLQETAQADTRTIKMAFPEGLKKFFAYEFGVIEMALDLSGTDYVMDIEELKGATQSRISEMLLAGDIDVMFAGYSAERESRFRQVNIPITRGILGHRVFMVKKDRAEALRNVETLDELRQFCIGVGSDWPDGDIMEDNGFCVERGPRSNLWEMLENRRFDALTRAVHEAYRELPAIQAQYPDVVLNDTVMLVYPFDFFIYVNRKNSALWQTITDGLLEAYRTGAFMEHFHNAPAIARALDALKTERRHVFNIENTIMSETTRNIDDRFWLNVSDLHTDRETGSPDLKCPPCRM
ncbi:hypothetical protein SAMN02744133_106135 [Thalassospira xiamenensis M-5 = DSM 17429]|nr:hypothetical protein SAMN02744133_106135 [Thalassospira xiamenensis M-5 = DSM 17429]